MGLRNGVWCPSGYPGLTPGGTGYLRRVRTPMGESSGSRRPNVVVVFIGVGFLLTPTTDIVGGEGGVLPGPVDLCPSGTSVVPPRSHSPPGSE